MNLKYYTLAVFLVLSLVHSSCYKEEEIPLVVDFHVSVVNESYTVPVQITVKNNTSGAIFYKWTFQGASSETSDEKQPGTITYSQAGTYTIRLEAWNDFDSDVKEITLQLDSAVTLNFDATILVNDFAPATLQITNGTTGASTYEWTFEGGTPASSASENPPHVQYDQPGDFVIGLRVTNGRESFYSTKAITIKPGMQADFSIVPSFGDEDYEAPFTATLENQTISGIRYEWSAIGGVISNTKAENTEIYFDSPGDYTVTLEADNDKGTQTIVKNITVKPNTNLYTIEHVKLGVSAAYNTFGCFYSIPLRSVFARDGTNETNGPTIDIAFFGINSGFSYCRFISPDSASKFTFKPIPGATHTYFINTVASGPIVFSVDDFNNMSDDASLQPLQIKDNDSGVAFFNNTVSPWIVLFETEDRRKGAIKIKSFVSDGAQSYIIFDIKVQKEAN